MNWVSSRLAVGLAAIALILAAGAVDSPAHALSSEWKLGYTSSSPGSPDFAQPGDVIDVTRLSLELEMNHSVAGPFVINCNNIPVSGLASVVPGVVPAGPPGGQIELTFDTPTSTVIGCTNSLGGLTYLDFIGSSAWTMTTDLPVVPGMFNGEAYPAPLTGTLTIPDGDPTGAGNGSVVITMSFPPPYPSPCVVQAPAYLDLEVPTSYDPSTGIASNTGSPTFFLDNGYWPGSYPPLSGVPAGGADCPHVGVAAVLRSISVTLENQDSKTPAVVWSL